MCVGMQSEVVEYFQQYDELWKQQDARALVESKWTTDGPFFIAAGFPEVHGREGTYSIILSSELNNRSYLEASTVQFLQYDVSLLWLYLLWGSIFFMFVGN